MDFVDINSERSVIAWGMESGELLCPVESFNDPGCRKVAQAIKDHGAIVIAKDIGIKLGVTDYWLLETKELIPPTRKNTEFCAQHVSDLSRRRELAEHSRKLMTEAHDFTRFIPMKDDLYDIDERIAAAKEGFRSYGSGMKFGLKEVDGFMGGLMGGQVFTVIAGSGVGKTMLAMNLYQRALYSSKELKAIFFSFEMDPKAFAKRELSIWKNVSLHELQKLEKDESAWNLIATEARNSYLSRCKVEFKPKSFAEMGQILDRNKDVRLIAIDYLQFIKTPNEENINTLMLQMKTFAKAHGVAIINLAQLDKVGGKESLDRRPTAYDALGGQGIKANSDWCVIMHKENGKKIAWFDKDREPMRHEWRDTVYELDFRKADGNVGMRLRDMIPIENIPQETENYGD